MALVPFDVALGYDLIEVIVPKDVAAAGVAIVTYNIVFSEVVLVSPPHIKPRPWPLAPAHFAKLVVTVPKSVELPGVDMVT
jgi:hypothetical protein